MSNSLPLLCEGLSSETFLVREFVLLVLEHVHVTIAFLIVSFFFATYLFAVSALHLNGC
jgi:hypothetical protein